MLDTKINIAQNNNIEIIAPDILGWNELIYQNKTGR